jgi:Tol biopolymer transport system component
MSAIWYIRLIDGDGAGERRLARFDGLAHQGTGKFDTQCDIAWSPEGTHIAFRRNEFIYSVEADGTHEQRLVRGLEPSWSPDGRHVAFLRDGSIYTIDTQGHVEHRLVRGDAFSWSPDSAWSPDGAFLVLTRMIKERELGVPGKYVVETVRPDGADRRAIWPARGGSCDCGDHAAWQSR